MNSVLEQIHAHRSIRKFKAKSVSENDLNTILEAATMASSSGNMQAYSIIVTEDKKVKEQMFDAHFKQSMLMDAPLFLTFCADFSRMRQWLKLREAKENFDNFMSFMIGSIDAILASQNAALAAESLGLGICYMGTTLASATEIGKVLGLPKNVIPVVGFALGHPDEVPLLRKRLPLEGVVQRERYQQYDTKSIEQVYYEKEVEALKRFDSFRDLEVDNLAQLYTQLKYTRESHIKYSDGLIDYLKDQNFL